MNFLEYIFGIVFPDFCLGCGAPGSLLCKKCGDRTLISSDFSDQFNHLDGIFSFFVYEGVSKKLIKKFKYGFSKKAFSKICGLIGGRRFPTCEIFVPVPISGKRIRKRGFNQAEMVATYLARRLGTGQILDCLSVKNHNVQATLGRKERTQNVKGIFEVKSPMLSKIKNRSLIIVDDVATTCSTLEECACVLKQSGAKNVTGIVLARGW